MKTSVIVWQTKHLSLILMVFLLPVFGNVGAFGGSLTAGILGRQYSVMSIGGFYLLVAAIGTLNGGMMVTLAPMLKRWVHVSDTFPARACVHQYRPSFDACLSVSCLYACQCRVETRQRGRFRMMKVTLA